MKIETMNKLYESAKETAEDKIKEGCQGVEIVFVPVVITKFNGKVGTISCVEADIIFKEENRE